MRRSYTYHRHNPVLIPTINGNPGVTPLLHGKRRLPRMRKAYSEAAVQQVRCSLFDRVDQAEVRLCIRINRKGRREAVRRFFSIVSRLGDGVFWYALMALLFATQGRQGMVAALHMAMIGALGVAIYKLLKERLVRERPFISSADIVVGTPPLDRYSFPSGHTLHAISFTLIALHYFPGLAVALIPFAALVAVSRVILGLHYPTDVLAGAAIGTSLALGSIQLIA